MSVLTVDQLKKRLQWDNIEEERRSQEYQGRMYYDRIFHIRPSSPDYPEIYFLFDDDVTSLAQLGFSEWHGHYDEFADERRNIVQAIKTARTLVLREACLVEERDAQGRYIGSSILGPDEIPRTVSKKARKLRRVFFDREPIEEEIDLSRYYEGKHLYVEKQAKKETERVFRESGMEFEF